MTKKSARELPGGQIHIRKTKQIAGKRIYSPTFGVHMEIHVEIIGAT